MASDARMSTSKVPALEAGDRLDQPTFHARYLSMPSHFRAELIGGFVHVPSPLKPEHGRAHAKLIQWLAGYEDATPGTESYDNTTVLLGPESEPQPDAFLIVAPGRGGQMRLNANGYLEGPPEFIAEIASSSESIDLHQKREEYAQGGVREYVVVALRQQQIHWFVAGDDELQEIPPDGNGIYQSRTFPGLWLDGSALLSFNGPRLLEVLHQGLATEEHVKFRDKLRS